APLADEAHQPVQYVGVGKQLAHYAVQEYSVVLLDLRVLQVVQIVAESGIERASIFREQLEGVVRVSDCVVIETALRAEVDDQKLPRFFGFHQRLLRQTLLDLAAVFRANTIDRSNGCLAADFVDTVSHRGSQRLFVDVDPGGGSQVGSDNEWFHFDT